ncbi:Membralin [Dirofilaria immitis]
MKYSKLFLFALFITIINLTIQEKCAECSETATYRTRVKRTWYPYPYGFYDPFGYRFGPFGQYGSFGVVGTRFGIFGGNRDLGFGAFFGGK